jgi:uncharacterized protein (DUF924 family)
MADYEAAAAGEHDDWAETRAGAMALVILLGQCPRNMFRGDPRTFSTDANALQISTVMVARGDDKAVEKRQWFFVHLPDEHSEAVAMQECYLEFTASMPQGKADNSPYSRAKKHYDVVAQYGRFPHRNAVVGRENTPEEEKYVAKPRAGF